MPIHPVVGSERNGGVDAIRIARPEKDSAGYRKTPEWMVVPGQAAAIPPHPPLPGRVAETEGRHSSRADRWCSISFGALVPYAPGPLDALHNEVT